MMVQVERIALAWNVGVDAVVDDPPPDFLEQLEKKRAYLNLAYHGLLRLQSHASTKPFAPL